MKADDFKAAFSPEATPEQIESVNRACAEVEGIGESFYLHKDYYVQDCNNQERFIRSDAEDFCIDYADALMSVMGIKTRTLDKLGDDQVIAWHDAVSLALAEPWQELWSAFKARGGGK